MKIGTDLGKAKALLEEGKLVAIPTETVYGLAANALNEDAVLRIFKAKNRPTFDPLIIHAASLEQVRPLLRDVPSLAERLFNHFAPGPLTILLPRTHQIPDLVTAGLGTVALRIPRHPLTLELLKTLDFPLAAPSANPFGYVSPTRPDHVAAQLEEQVSYILDGGPAEVGLESTIVQITSEDKMHVLRKGGLPIENLEALGPVKVFQHSTSNPRAPGMLKSHYAPRKPLKLGYLDELLAGHPNQRVGVLAFKRTIPEIPAAQQRILSPEGDLAEAARNLFAAIRSLDTLDIDLILAEWVPEKGLGRAINDRLRRASAE
ncbi:MAG: L-threonylcarbamoyladenylate synthase [Bacteroidota bacterium]